MQAHCPFHHALIMRAGVGSERSTVVSSCVELDQHPKIRVMLVNHNESFLRVAADFLGRSRDLAVVGLFSRTEEVLSTLVDLRPQVILLDLDVPAHAGLEAVRRLRDALPHTGIITLSLSSASAYRKAALAAGADALVNKSDLTSGLLPAIRQAVRRRCTLATA